jgi:hypothetical protein
MNSESKFWSTLPIATKKIKEEGIILHEKPFDLERDTISIGSEDLKNLQLKINEEISEHELMFMLEHGMGASGNSIMIDPRLKDHSIVVKLINKDTKDIYGFCISIKCTLYLQGKDTYEIISSVMTSHLCIHLKHRNKELAKYVISGAIDEAFKTDILTGYHFIDEPKTESNVKIYNYYRPLNIMTSLESGYQVSSIKKPSNSFYLDNLPSKSQLKDLENEYSTSGYDSYSFTPSVFEDLQFLQHRKRKLSLLFSAMEFEKLNKMFHFYTVKDKHKIIGLVIYKLLLVHIGKLGKVCSNAQICLLEMKDDSSHIVLSKLINHLQKNQFIVMTGACFGALSDEKLRKNFGFVTSGYQYLDFYNLNVKLKDSKDVNVLYY